MRRPRQDLSSKSRCIPLRRKFLRRCTGARGWLKKTTTRPWRELTTRSCRSVFAIFITESWRAAALASDQGTDGAAMIRHATLCWTGCPESKRGQTSPPATRPPTTCAIRKRKLLENGALVDFAVRELQAAGKEDKGTWVAAETARLYQDAGRYDGAIQVFKRAVPNYFAVDLPTLPRPYWEALFPKAVLDRSEKILNRERAGSLSGGVADSAGVGV